MTEWIADRLKERSTWLGLISLTAAIGVTLQPDQVDAVIAAGMAVGGLVAAFTRG